MKRIFSAALCFLLIGTLIVPVSALETNTVIYHQETDCGNGVTMVDEVIEHSQIRSSTKGYTRTKTIRYDGIIIGKIAVYGSFKYDGTTVSVITKRVNQADTYEGWSYKQNSFTSSGGTITLDAKLTKLLVMNIPFTITLSCDKDGNISYT